jgi:hypothetical protein
MKYNPLPVPTEHFNIANRTKCNVYDNCKSSIPVQ